MGGRFYSVGIDIILEHIYSGMWIIYKGCFFGDMVIQIGIYFSNGLHIDATSKGPNGGQFLFLGFKFLDHIINCISFWKLIVKLERVVQGIWPNCYTQVGYGQHSLYIVSQCPMRFFNFPIFIGSIRYSGIWIITKLLQDFIFI